MTKEQMVAKRLGRKITEQDKKDNKHFQSLYKCSGCYYCDADARTVFYPCCQFSGKLIIENDICKSRKDALSYY